MSDDVLFGLTSASGTHIVPSTLSYRGTASASHLGDSHTGTANSSFIPTSPSRTGLSRSRVVKRRSRATSLTFSSSYPSEESSDKENSSYTPTRLYSDEYSSRDDGLSTLETYTRESWTRSGTSTPFPSTETPRDEEPHDSDPSTAYDTAMSPSIKSVSDIPTIPSEYETASEHDTEYETAAKSITEDASTEFSTAEVCKSDQSSEYVTCPKCGSERSTAYSTAELCPSDASTEYETAVCRCQAAVLEPLPKELSDVEPAEKDFSIGKEPSELSYLDLDLTKEVEEEPQEESLQLEEEEEDFGPELEEEQEQERSVFAPSVTPTIPSLLSYQDEEKLRPEDVPLPASLYSPSLLSSVGLSALELEPTVPTPSTLQSLSDSMLSPTQGQPPLSEPPESFPTTSLLSSVTESSVSPTPPKPISLVIPPPLVPLSPSIRESEWPPETDISFESSMLRASPSVQSVAPPEGPDISFETSVLWPTASAVSSQDIRRLSTITESVSTPSSSVTPSSSSSSSSSLVTPVPSELLPAPPAPPAPSPALSLVTSSPAPSLLRVISPTHSPLIPVLSTPLLSSVVMTPSSPSDQPTTSLPTSTSVLTPSLSQEVSSVTVTRTPSSVSTVSSIGMRSSVFDTSSLMDFPLEVPSTEPSLLSTHRSSTLRSVSLSYVISTTSEIDPTW